MNDKATGIAYHIQKPTPCACFSGCGLKITSFLSIPKNAISFSGAQNRNFFDKKRNFLKMWIKVF